jgi:hypothetical protein
MTLNSLFTRGRAHLTRRDTNSQGRWTILALAALLACQPGQSTPAPSPPPPRPVGLGSGQTIDRAKVLAAGRAQRYDENPGSSLRAVLDDGVQATIEPDEGAFNLPESALDEGVVVARFRNEGDAPLKRLGIVPRGTTFWFIYRKDKQLMSAYIADTESGEYDVVDVPTMLHPPTRPWRQSVAQWQLPGVIGEKVGTARTLLYGGQQPWVSCTSMGCCKPAN